MESIRKALPSFFTSLGLVSGCISIVISTVSGNLTLAGYFILIAAVFDFVDGFVARLVNNVSAFGKELDSLSDVVSFGVAPSMILHRLMLLSYVNSSPEANFDLMNPGFLRSVVLYSTFLVAVFSALRLAKFNLDPKQTKNFRGLPVPANAIFFAAIGFAAESDILPGTGILFSKAFILIAVAISCFLLVSNIGMFSLKFSTYDFRKNFLRYLFLALAALILICYGLPGLAPIILMYILISLANNFFVKME
jgi:CDP-diacylglycerol--serine O-phosphatidyltransferase